MEKSNLGNKRLGLLLVAILSISLFSATASGDIPENPSKIIDYESPKLFIPNDIYVFSKNPIQVDFKVKAIDNVGGKVQVQCDKISGAIFKLGKTVVRCEAKDSVGNTSKTSFIVTIGYNIVQIPSWIKQPTKLWIENSIDDKTYAKTMGFLIKEQLVHIPFTKSPNYPESEIPIWIKTHAKSWIDDEISDDEYSDDEYSDDEYSIILQWLLNRNII